MLDIKKTVRNATFILIICILVIAFFEVAPIIERQYSSRYFVVVFNSGVDKNVEVLVDENKPVIKPEEPKRDGFKFMGWYYKGKEYDFSTYVIRDMMLIAKWEEVKEEEIIIKPIPPEERDYYIVTFDVMGGSLIADQQVTKGGTATIPNVPTREGYTFVEWRYEGKLFDFGTILSGDITLVAVWKEN